jgi:hypothetical protein
VTPGEELPYRTAAALRTALRDRLAKLAHTNTTHGLDELQRQLAYDRLLARVFNADDADRWVFKGAGALLARLSDARHSRDIDLAFTGSSPARTAAAADEQARSLIDDAVASLRTAINTDLGDFFRFEIPRISTLPEAAKGCRVHVETYLGPRYASFHVDLVVGTAMSGTPEPGPPLVPLDIPGLIRPDYRLFPLTDHIADKFCAIIETHQHADGTQPSTRVKDLVDLALIAGTQHIDADQLTVAVRAGAAHRALLLPERLAIPDTPLWRHGYPARAREAARAVPDFDQAMALVTALLDPALQGTARGTWNPRTASWT